MKLVIDGVSKNFANTHGQKLTVLEDINLTVAEEEFVALVGPSGCGKSTLLNLTAGLLEPSGGSIYFTEAAAARVPAVGIVFQETGLFPWRSVYENIAFGVRMHEKLTRNEMDDRVEWALTKAALWNEVKDKLNKPGTGLSGGQQQRLCIARGVAVKPQVLLLDEPTSALDPISTMRIEDLIHELKREFTIAIVTHNMQQAARVSDYTAYMYLGELIEFGKTDELFIKPQDKRTEDYITGRVG